MKASSSSNRKSMSGLSFWDAFGPKGLLGSGLETMLGWGPYKWQTNYFWACSCRSIFMTGVGTFVPMWWLFLPCFLKQLDSGGATPTLLPQPKFFLKELVCSFGALWDLFLEEHMAFILIDHYCEHFWRLVKHYWPLFETLLTTIDHYSKHYWPILTTIRNSIDHFQDTIDHYSLCWTYQEWLGWVILDGRFPS